MAIIRQAKRMSALSAKLRADGQRIGIVPTMGALHEGHLSLIRAARAQNDVVVVTIFVNPLQFGPREDLRRYPRQLAKDVKLSKQAGADHIFAPSVNEMYPEGFQTSMDIGPLATRWEGSSRPGHFRGVATVVTILFELTHPTVAYVGQKDYQQALIIRRLVRDLRLPVTVAVLPTVRDSDGLAMSSRNASLSATERREATVVYRALQEGKTRIQAGERKGEAVLDLMRSIIVEASSAAVDYLAVVDAATLEPLWKLKGRVALLAAVHVGRTRLIDNLLVDVP